MRGMVAVLVIGTASSAFANDALGKVLGALGFSLIEVSCKVSSAATSSSASSGSAKKYECSSNSDCHSSYECFSGQCLAHASQDPVVVQQPAPVPLEDRASLGGRCGLDADCDDGLTCRYSMCIQPPQKCGGDAACGGGETCVAGHCQVAAPLPSSSLQRRASELYLRARVVELREELALGRGPVINGLANVEGVPAKKLGRTLREHRAELVALIGDASSTDWSAKFLTRVDELSRT